MLRIFVTLIVTLEVLTVAQLVPPERDRNTSREHVAFVPERPHATPDYASRCTHKAPVGLNEALVQAASEFGIDPKVLFVTVLRESGCRVRARGTSGEVGLGQVLPRVWLKSLRDAGILSNAGDLWDVGVNLRASAYILSRLSLDASGDLHGMFRRYNGSGPKARVYAREQVRVLASL